MRFSRALLLLPLFSFASLIAVACGDDPAPAFPSDAGSDAPDDSAAHDTGASDGGGGSDAKGDGRVPTGRGTFNVVLFSPTPEALAVGFYQSAGFDRIAPPFDAGPSRVKCTSTFLDHCYLSSCEFPTDDAGPGPQPPAFDGGTPNVGTITVSGYAVDGGTISMPVNDAGKYTTFVDPNGGFSGGEVITYSWLGASDPSEGPVGAFTKVTTAPAKIDLTKPVVSDGGIGVISDPARRRLGDHVDEQGHATSRGDRLHHAREQLRRRVVARPAVQSTRHARFVQGTRRAHATDEARPCACWSLDHGEQPRSARRVGHQHRRRSALGEHGSLSRLARHGDARMT
jgi:hypothetical protein